MANYAWRAGSKLAEKDAQSMKLVLGWLLVLVSACNEDVSGKSVIGNYDVMISAMGKSDPDVLSIVTGHAGVLVLSFSAGITTDSGAVNASGLRATLGEGNTLTLAMQPAHIDHPLGLLNGSIYGTGKVTGNKIMMTLHYAPTNFAIGQSTDADGGIVLMRKDAGPGNTLDYDLTGQKQM
jgi:hypothetical protein